MVTVTKTITEHTNGRMKDPAYSTGWKRRAGATRDPMTKKVAILWEEAPAPTTYVYGSHEHQVAGFKGGVVETVIEGTEAGTYDLDADEVESLIRQYARTYTDLTRIVRGWKVVGGGTQPSPDEAGRLLEQTRVRCLKFGVDLAETNVGA